MGKSTVARLKLTDCHTLTAEDSEDKTAYLALSCVWGLSNQEQNRGAKSISQFALPPILLAVISDAIEVIKGLRRQYWRVGR